MPGLSAPITVIGSSLHVPTSTPTCLVLFPSDTSISGAAMLRCDEPGRVHFGRTRSDISCEIISLTDLELKRPLSE